METNVLPYFVDQIPGLDHGGDPLFRPAGIGQTFFVDSTSGNSASEDGRCHRLRLPTLAAAIGKCTANKGDTIIVIPGHAETITAADGFDVTVAGIRIIGLGIGDTRPTFTFTNTAGACAIGADNVWIENLRFVAGVSAVVVPLTIEGKVGCTIKDCEFYWGGTTGWDFIDSIILNAGSHRTTIEGCRFIAEPGVAGAATGVKLSGASHNVEVIGNEFSGDFSTACVNGITTLSQHLIFANNTVHNTDAGEPYLEVLTGTTGIICNTRGRASGATIAANAVADAMSHCENFVTNSAGAIAIVKGAGGVPALDVD
jgi:hypothetical protein